LSRTCENMTKYSTFQVYMNVLKGSTKSFMSKGEGLPHFTPFRITIDLQISLSFIQLFNFSITQSPTIGKLAI
jgi:hypothetical protein